MHDISTRAIRIAALVFRVAASTTELRGVRALTQPVWRAALRALALMMLAGGISERARSQRHFDLPSSPSLEIRANGESEKFGWIIGATVLSTGDVVVADEETLRVLVYSNQGRLLKSIGGRDTQRGPFRTMTWLGQCARDTVYIHDPLQNRMTTIDATGEITGARIAAFPGQPVAIPYTMQCSRGGMFGMIGWPADPGRSETGAHRSTVRVAVAPHFGGTQVEVRRLSSPERYWPEKNEGPWPLGRSLSLALSPTTIFLGTADSFTVQMFDSRGSEQGVIGRPLARRRLTKEHKNGFIALWTSRKREGRQRDALRAQLAGFRYPEFLPAYRRLLVDPRNRLWIQEFSTPADRTCRWWIFRGNGDAAGSLVVPSEFDMMEVGEKYVLGKWTDARGVETVRLYVLSSL